MQSCSIVIGSNFNRSSISCNFTAFYLNVCELNRKKFSIIDSQIGVSQNKDS